MLVQVVVAVFRKKTPERRKVVVEGIAELVGRRKRRDVSVGKKVEVVVVDGMLNCKP